MSLYSGSETYSVSSETTLDESTLKAAYYIGDVSTLMKAIVKIKGEHTIRDMHFTLLDNDQVSVNCRAVSNYSRYNDETVITISPQSSNSIGGINHSWSISGAMTLDGDEISLDINSSLTPMIKPTLPTNIPNAYAPTFEIKNVAVSTSDVTSCVVYLASPESEVFTPYELVGIAYGEFFGDNVYIMERPIRVVGGVVSFNFHVFHDGIAHCNKVVITSDSHGVFTFE